MNRIYILLTVMVVMVAAFFAGHEALAEVLTGTAGNDALLGTDRDDRLDGRGGDDEIEGGSGNDEIFPAKATTRWTLARATTLSMRATPAGWIT
jgi:Ca2+-binding RTX toxin-like protein